MSDPLPAASLPAVSVIVPAWGVAHLVGGALASLQHQDFTDWEAIVVDDGSTDDVGGAVAPFARADPRIRFLPTAHRGVSAARNAAIAEARAPLIALLDGDDVWEPGYLSCMVKAIEADPRLGFVTCDAIYTGGTRRDGRRFSAFAPQAGEPTLEAVLSRTFNVFVGTTARRHAIVDVGGFDEGLVASEDLDLWLRLLAAGWRGSALAEPLVRYRRRPGSLSSSPLRLYRSSVTVYDRAAAALDGRPEAATARTMAARMRAEANWAEGEDLLIAGRVRDGLAQLRLAHAARRSAVWAMAMLLFRVAPFAAPAIVRRRRRAAAA